MDMWQLIERFRNMSDQDKEYAECSLSSDEFQFLYAQGLLSARRYA